MCYPGGPRCDGYLRRTRDNIERRRAETERKIARLERALEAPPEERAAILDGAGQTREGLATTPSMTPAKMRRDLDNARARLLRLDGREERLREDEEERAAADPEYAERRRQAQEDDSRRRREARREKTRRDQSPSDAD